MWFDNECSRDKVLSRLTEKLERIGGSSNEIRRILIRHDKKMVLDQLKKIESNEKIRYKFSYLKRLLESKDGPWRAQKTM